VILDILNCSLNNSTFPNLWKNAHIQPIPKVAHPKEMSDFRPIALLSALSKPLERFVHNATLDHLSKYNLLDQYQSGFKKGYSTQSALLKVTDDIRYSIEQQKLTLLVLLDFSKAL
jgi:hypothetical protein